MTGTPTEAACNEQRILDSWAVNATAWIRAIRSASIASRSLATDTAVVEAVLDGSPRSVTDLGCGEGWLARALAHHGIEVRGYDAVGELVDAARRDGGGSFEVLDYRQLAACPPAPADAVVCNFSLFGSDSVEAVFGAMTAMLNPGGRFIVQTLHPSAAPVSGWQPGSWDGIGGSFTAPPPWYARTREQWLQLYQRHNLAVLRQREPAHPETGLPLSLVLIGAHDRDRDRLPPRGP